MAGNISLAWAVAVDQSQLIARVIAYVKAKDSMVTLMLCHKHSTSRAFRKTPREVMNMIQRFLQDKEYEDEYPQWHSARGCAHSQCKPVDHFAKHEIVDRLESGWDWLDDRGKLWEESIERHDLVIIDYLKTVRFINRKQNARMLRRGKKVNCSPLSLNFDGDQLTGMTQILLQKFGICPYFTIIEMHYTECEFMYDWVADVSAYLAMPITQVVPESRPAPGKASYVVQKTLDPQRISRKLSEDVGPRFQKVMNRLRLNAPHTPALVYKRRSLEELGHEWMESKVLLSDDEDSEQQLVICRECHDAVCHKDEQEVMRPELMMLGSGEMEALEEESEGEGGAE